MAVGVGDGVGVSVGVTVGEKRVCLDDSTINPLTDHLVRILFAGPLAVKFSAS